MSLITLLMIRHNWLTVDIRQQLEVPRCGVYCLGLAMVVVINAREKVTTGSGNGAIPSLLETATRRQQEPSWIKNVVN